MTRLVAILFCTVLIVDHETADRWGHLTGKARQEGRQLPVLDGLLAATAIQHNLMLVTRNARDVARTGVPVLNPWESLIAKRSLSQGTSDYNRGKETV